MKRSSQVLSEGGSLTRTWSRDSTCLLGEHTEQVLTQVAGCTVEQQAALRRAGVIGEAWPLEP